MGLSSREEMSISRSYAAQLSSLTFSRLHSNIDNQSAEQVVYFTSWIYVRGNDGTGKECLHTNEPFLRPCARRCGVLGKQGLTYASVSAESVEAQGMHLQIITIPPRGRAKRHRHAAHETASYVLSGIPRGWYGEQLENHFVTQWLRFRVLFCEEVSYLRHAHSTPFRSTESVASKRGDATGGDESN